MLNRQEIPAIQHPIDFNYHLAPINTLILDNGIPLYHISDDIQPVLQLELVFPAGIYTEDQKGIAQATASLLKSGTSQKTSLEINELFEQYGASVKAGAGSDWSSLTISCLSKHLGQLLHLVVELLTDTQFPQHEIDLFIQNSLQRLSVQLKKSDFVANRQIDKLLFGYDHPYGRYLVAEDYQQITQGALNNHLKKHYNSASCKLFLAGSFGENELRLINETLGKSGWNNPEPDIQLEKPIHPAPEKHHRMTNNADGVQGAIRLASPFPNRLHPDFVPMIVLNTLFGAYFGSRLMSNIREEKGYTYGIHSYMYNHRFQSAYLITTEAGKDVCEATVAEIYLEMKRLREEAIPEDELLLVKNYLLGNLLGDLDGSFQIIQRWKNLILNDFTGERFQANIKIYKSVSTDELMALAQTYYQPDRFYELVVI
ncbi:MAG: insulinase family protein [Chitinophagaceae bacterium]|nr:insulinase family protein [Chitinophagaceae bacterium]